MSLLGIDLGGTKLTLALFDRSGNILQKDTSLLEKTGGSATASFIKEKVAHLMQTSASQKSPVQAIGISVPGISRKQSDTVWAPNIPGWTNYPLLKEIQSATNGIPIQIESDRTCYVLGERWKGKAQGYDHLVFLAIGTGIGAGILVNGQVLDGAHGSAGSVGWMTMHPSFMTEYGLHGFFECWASGEGMIRLTRKKMEENASYIGGLRQLNETTLTTRSLFEAADQQDPLATDVIQTCVSLWGMGIANLSSLFDPSMVVLGGGVFGPAAKYLPKIREQALKWGQPQSMPVTEITISALGTDAGVFGAGFLALQALNQSSTGN